MAKPISCRSENSGREITALLTAIHSPAWVPACAACYAMFWTRDMPTASVRAGRLFLYNANGGGECVDREEGGLVAKDQENHGELGPRGALQRGVALLNIA